MKIVAVVVIYNTPINLSNTIISLNKVSKEIDLSSLELIIYDNSPQEQKITDQISINVTYFNNKENGGLAAAYNYALNKSLEWDIEWLLLLDQDTTLNYNYFETLYKALSEIKIDKDTVCLLPHVVSNGINISPVILKKGGFVKRINSIESGFLGSNITGINSGTVLNVHFIQSLGKFNPMFKIDMLDYWYFKMIHDKNKKILIMNSILEHDLSVMNYKNVSTERYKNIVKAEIAFFHDYCTKVDFFIFKLRLLLRLIKQLKTLKNNKIPVITFHYLVSKNG